MIVLESNFHITLTQNIDFLLEESYFYDVSVTGSGGAIYYSFSTKNVNFKCISFNNCHSVDAGGAFFLQCSKASIQKVKFIECYHTRIEVGYNGATGWIIGTEYEENLSTLFSCGPNKTAGKCCNRVENSLIRKHHNNISYCKQTSSQEHWWYPKTGSMLSYSNICNMEEGFVEEYGIDVTVTNCNFVENNNALTYCPKSHILDSIFLKNQNNIADTVISVIRCTTDTDFRGYAGSDSQEGVTNIQTLNIKLSTNCKVIMLDTCSCFLDGAMKNATLLLALFMILNYTKHQ